MMGTKQTALGMAIVPLVAAWLLPSSSSPGHPAVQEAEQAPPPGFELSGDLDRGRTIYTQYCTKCHGKKGNGTGMMARDLDPKPRDFTDKSRMDKRTDWQIFFGIKEGGAAVGLSHQMTGWKDTLTEQEIHDVALYIRQFAK